MQKKQNHYQKTTFVFYLILFFLPSLAGAPLIEDITIGTTTITLPFVSHDVNIQSVILSGILFLTGGYLCFLGGIHQRLTIFIIGFYVGSNLTYVILLNAKEDYGINTDTLFLTMTIVVGILTGRLLLCSFFLAVYLVGALMGYFSALWLLSWATNGLIQTNWGRAILILGSVLVGVVMVAFFERLLMMVATAFIGSFAIFIGLDVYVMTGFAESVITFLHAWKSTATTDSIVASAKTSSSMVIAEATPQLRGMLVGCLGLAVLGTLIQFGQLRRRSHPPKIFKQAPQACNQLHPYDGYKY
ncbi:hypothetical protein BC941DRAFT_469713 [Chlamydoabsidia padenii]|nr:hypothetical protein BC941DRAFT_469713 [Chlamydoabsidia padenii]